MPRYVGAGKNWDVYGICLLIMSFGIKRLGNFLWVVKTCEFDCVRVSADLLYFIMLDASQGFWL